MPTKKQNKVIVITGSTRGIGFAIAEKFHKEGYFVVLNSAKSVNQSIVKKFEENGIYVQADISKKSECKRLIEQTFKQHGRIDVLVNNAGIYIPQDRMAESDRVKMFQTKLDGIQYCSDYAIERGVRSIVNISSVYAQSPDFDARLSSALQAGVENMTLNYATRFAGKVNVNAIAPGYTDTSMVRENISAQVLRKIIKNVPIRRLIKASEIADVAYFLADTQIISGQVITADGGYRLK